MRVVSLLPSLTELVHALGRGDWLVGVTHECDFPPGVEKLPHLTRSLIPPGADSATIDALVAAQGGSLYALDAALLESLEPDLILTQAQCDVCAVNETRVREVAAKLPDAPKVESVNPTTLGEVFDMFHQIGECLCAVDQATKIIANFESTVLWIREVCGNEAPKRLVLLEWVDPPYSSGHWNPAIIALAGGIEPLAKSGQPSRRVTWEDLAAADPDVILVSACGFSIERTLAELGTLGETGSWKVLRAVRNGQVGVTDGSAFFSRPGPRLEESLRVAARCIHRDDMRIELDPRSLAWLSPLV